MHRVHPETGDSPASAGNADMGFSNIAPGATEPSDRILLAPMPGENAQAQSTPTGVRSEEYKEVFTFATPSKSGEVEATPTQPGSRSPSPPKRAYMQKLKPSITVGGAWERCVSKMHYRQLGNQERVTTWEDVNRQTSENSRRGDPKYSDYEKAEQEKEKLSLPGPVDFVEIVTNSILPTMIHEDQEELVHTMTSKRVIFLRAGLRNLRLREKQKEKLISGCIYAVFMIMFFVIAVLQRNIQQTFLLQSALSSNLQATKDETGNQFDEIRTQKEIFTWLRTAMIPMLFFDHEDAMFESIAEDMNVNLRDADHNRYFMQYNKIIGGLMITQQRIQPRLCNQDVPEITAWFNTAYLTASHTSQAYCSKLFSEYYPVVYPQFHREYKATSPFGPSHDLTKYRFEDSVKGGGYFVYTGSDPELVRHIFEELEHDDWLTKATRVMSIRFPVYNGNYRLFSVVTLDFEFHPTGLVSKSITYDSFKLENYVEPVEHFRLALEIMFTVYTIASIGVEIAYMARMLGNAHSKQGGVSREILDVMSDKWVLIDIARLGTFTGFLWVWVIINTHETKTLLLPLPDGYVYYDFEPITTLYHRHMNISIITTVLCLLSFFKYVHYNPRLGIIVRTVTHAAPELGQFFLTFLCIWCTFAIMGMMMFGPYAEEWSSFEEAFMSLISMLTVENGLEEIKAWPSGLLFYMLFLMVVIIVLLNILLAILIESYIDLATEAEELEARGQDNLSVSIQYEVWAQITYFWVVMVRSIAGAEKVSKDRFITTQQMVEILDTPQLKDEAVYVPGVPTLKDPNPPAEWVVTFPMLIKMNVPPQTARLLMAVMGSDWTDPEAEEPDEMTTNMEFLKESMGSLYNENQHLKEEVASIKAVLNQVFYAVRPPSLNDSEFPIANRNVPYNPIYNAIYNKGTGTSTSPLSPRKET